MKRNKLFPVFAAAVCLLAACTKNPGEGFLGNKFYYLSNPFIGIKGRVTTSVPIQADGSTLPLTVKLLEVRDRSGKPTDVLGKQYEIPIYKGEVTPADSTPALLAQKIGLAMYTPFNVNSNGGRLELTPATAMIDTGTYNFDIEVSNLKGTRTIKNVAKVVISPVVSFQIVRQFASTSAPNQEAVTTTQSAFALGVERREGPNKIIIKFADKNGALFNPKTGQVVPRVSAPTALRYEFRQFAPYYAEEKTDTALVYTYPEKLPVFPLFQLNTAYLASYRIPSNYNDLGMNLNPEFSVRFFPTDKVPYVSGTWIVTNRMPFAAKKP